MVKIWMDNMGYQIMIKMQFFYTSVCDIPFPNNHKNNVLFTHTYAHMHTLINKCYLTFSPHNNKHFPIQQQW